MKLINFLKRASSKYSNDNIAVCMIVTGNYAFSIATTAQGLIEHNRHKKFKFYIIHDGIALTDQEILKKILLDVEFITFSNDFFHKKISKVLKKEYDFNKIESLLKTRKFYFIGKVLSLELLHKHSKVLYLDTDLLIQGSLEKIFEIQGVAWRNAAVSGTKKVSSIVTNRDCFLNINDDFSAPNAGVMFFTHHIEYKSVIYDCYYMLQNCHSELRADIDEALIAWSCYKNKCKITNLPYKYNQWAYSATDETIILHAIGNINFWSANFRKIVFSKWLDYYNNWIGLGGTECDESEKDLLYISSSKELGKTALCFEYMLFWENLYNQLDSKFPSMLYRAGPMAKVYSKLHIRDVPKFIHYEIGIHNMIGEGWVCVKFFYKDTKILTSEIFGNVTNYFESTEFSVVNRTDILEITSIPISTRDISTVLYRLYTIIENDFPELYSPIK